MTALVNVGPTATLGLRAVDVLNADGTSTAGFSAFAGQGTSQPLRVQSSNSLGAPLSILTLAVTHPRDGTVVMQGQELNAEAILAGAGTGTVIGQWLWDDNVVEQFSASVVGGQRAAIQTRQSLPTWYLGVHTLQLRIVQPNQVATRTIAIVVNPGNWRLEKLLGPAYGAIFSPENPPLLLWAPVPGADKYQVGFSTRPYLSTIDKWYDVGGTLRSGTQAAAHAKHLPLLRRKFDRRACGAGKNCRWTYPAGMEARGQACPLPDYGE